MSEPPGPDHGQHLLEVVAEQLGGELRLACAHPVDVAAQRVDLAVVGDHPVRVGKLPARERVRRVAGVHEREGAREAGVVQVGVEARELRRHQHPLVDERAGGQARHDEGRAGGELGDPPDHVELALERILVAGQIGRGADEELADVRHDGERRAADVCGLDRHVAPAEQHLPFGGDRLLDELLQRPARLACLRQEARSDPVRAGGRQPVAEDGAEERVRDLDEDAGAVARVRVRALRAAVLEVRERGQRLGHRLAARLAAQARDEGDAARVVLERGVVQPGAASRCERWVIGSTVRQRLLPRSQREMRRAPPGVASRRWRRGGRLAQTRARRKGDDARLAVGGRARHRSPDPSCRAL